MSSLTTGRDLTLIIVTEAGPKAFNTITNFSSAPITEDYVSHGIDGANRFETFEQGWRGQFTIDRTDATLDKYFAEREVAFYGGQARAPSSITELIAEADGSISRFRYIGVVLKLIEAGEFRGMGLTRQSVSFVADRRLFIP